MAQGGRSRAGALRTLRWGHRALRTLASRPHRRPHRIPRAESCGLQHLGSPAPPQRPAPGAAVTDDATATTGAGTRLLRYWRRNMMRRSAIQRQIAHVKRCGGPQFAVDWQTREYAICPVFSTGAVRVTKLAGRFIPCETHGAMHSSKHIARRRKVCQDRSELRLIATDFGRFRKAFSVIGIDAPRLCSQAGIIDFRPTVVGCGGRRCGRFVNGRSRTVVPTSRAATPALFAPRAAGPFPFDRVASVRRALWRRVPSLTAPRSPD